jgi:NDP-sugar pyrophosphorylase family protein
MYPSTTDVLILAGGRGTRLQSAVPDCPKVLATVNGRPFVLHLLDALADAGFRRAILCTGWRAAQVEQALGTSHLGIALAYSVETSPLGTAGALRQAVPLLASASVMILNGDSFLEVDYGALCAWYRATQPALGLVLRWMPDVRRYGRVETDTEGRVLRFEEKSAAAGAGYINGGIYLTAATHLRALPAGVPWSLETQWLPSFPPGALRGFPCTGRFIDIGTPESYRAATEFFP